MRARGLTGHGGYYEAIARLRYDEGVGGWVIPWGALLYFFALPLQDMHAMGIIGFKQLRCISCDFPRWALAPGASHISLRASVLPSSHCPTRGQAQGRTASP